MKVTKQIQQAFIGHSRAYNKSLKFKSELYSWVEKQGIDTQDESFMDAIGVRISEDEFQSFEEFVEDLKRYKNGEDVGYG